MKKPKVGFFKKPQGVFTSEVIKSIENKLRAEKVELVTDLDFREGYVRSGDVYVGNYNLNDLDVYFWHDTVRPMIWKGDNYYLNLLRALEKDCQVINNSESTRIVNDKYLAHLALTKNNLPVAEFALVSMNEPELARQAFKDLGGDVVIKQRYGGWGVGVVRIKEADQLIETLELLLSHLPAGEHQLFMEKFYPNDLSKWISVVVMGDKVLFGYQKKNLGTSDWKVYDPNKQDGKGENSVYIDPSGELKKISLQAKEAIGKDIICFDFISTDEGYKIVDENGRPGIYPRCLEGAGIDIEKEIVDLILSKLEN